MDMRGHQWYNDFAMILADLSLLSLCDYSTVIQFVLFLLVATFFDDEVGSEEGWRGPRQLTRPDRFSWDKWGLHVRHNMLHIFWSTVPGVF